jgi:23S rRNA (cytosine1962-C5)-methyltransferase
MTAARLRLRVTRAAESRLRDGHPWLYSDSILAESRPGELGDLAVVYDRNDRFLAVGLYDPGSPIALRVLHVGKPLPIDRGFFERRLAEALARREGAIGEATDGYRVLNGESDGLPGLVLDRYADTLVVKLYSAAWFPHWEMVLGIIEDSFPESALVLRLSRNITAEAESRGYRDGTVLRGQVADNPLIFTESGIRFEADVLRGQKTGFFLDQRENRRMVEDLARGRRVLNAFSFSGGFSLYAARGGATTVMSLDISPHALAAAERNFALNDSIAAVRTCRHEPVQADVFEWLRLADPNSFDLIALDPPSLARREAERERAIGAYQRLASDALRLLGPGGVLVSSSCSAHVSEEEFFSAVRAAMNGTGRLYRELGTTGQPPDHPATFPEARYLKAIYLELD